MKKKKVKKLILVFALTLMIITSNFYIYANDTKGANEILIQILNNADLSKINYLQGINIKENEYQEIFRPFGRRSDAWPAGTVLCRR